MSSPTTSIFLTLPTHKPTDIALILQQSQSQQTTHNNDTILTNNDLLQNLNHGKTQIKNSPLLQILPSYRNSPSSSPSIDKVPFPTFITLALPAVTLFSAILTYFICDAHGWDAIFPSKFTTHIVFKLAVWGTLLSVVAREQAHFWYGSYQGFLFFGKKNTWVNVEVIIYHVGSANNGADVHNTVKAKESINTVTFAKHNDALTIDSNATVSPTKMLKTESTLSSSKLSIDTTPSSYSSTTASAPTLSGSPIKRVPSVDPPVDEPKKSSSSLSSSPTKSKSVNTPSPKNNTTTDPTTSTSSPNSTTTTTNTNVTSPSSPEKRKTMTAETTIPFRFIRATKGDLNAARQRWADTCTWRAELGMDEILYKPHPNLHIIKENYPHYFHLRGKKNEPCYFERPPQMNINELKKHGVNMEELLRHYALCCEYMWSEIEDSEEGKSIYVIDLDGIGIRDFAGDVVDFVKRASAFTAAHYPERSGSIYVINVPSWFSIIWNVVKPMVDDVTKKKITIMRHGKEAITKALMEKIDIENIPPEYGGKSMPLGESPQEKQFKAHFEKLGLLE